MTDVAQPLAAGETADDSPAASPIGELVCEIYPELVASAFKAREIKLYSVWHILRTIDIRQRQARAHWKTTQIQEVMYNVLGVSPKHTYALLRAGEGKYWSQIGGPKGRRSVQIYSLRAVVRRLGFTMSRTAPFLIQMEYLLVNWSELESLMLAFVAARHTDGRGCSYASVMEHTGLSLSTIKRHLRRCPHLQKYTNYAKVYGGDNHATAVAILDKLMRKDRAGKAWRVAFVDGVYYVLRQLPNTYSIGEAERGHLRGRPKPFRSTDRENGADFGNKLYYLRRESADTAPADTRYAWDKKKFLPGLGTVRLWEVAGHSPLPETFIEDVARAEETFISRRCLRIALQKHAAQG